MCGRYAASRDVQEMQLLFDFASVESRLLPPSYNIAPTQETYIVDSYEGERRLRVVNWGLVPAWSRDVSGAARLINARAESVAEKPSFKAAFAKRRCLVPMDGWYEWQGAGKQPWFLSRADGLAAVAGIYERWRPANADPGNAAAVYHSMAILTTDASADTAHVHDRMPVLIDRADFAAWLDPDTEPAELQHLLHPPAEGTVRAWRVSRAVSQVRNNEPALIEPVDPPVPPSVVEQPSLW